MKQFLTSKEIAKKLRVTARTVRRLAKEGRIPAVALSKRKYVYDPEEVEKALKAGKTG